MTTLLRKGLITALLAMAGCAGGSDDDGDTDALSGPRGDCDPLDPSICALPFPSSHYLVEDASTASGRRVAFGPTSLPQNKGGHRIDPAAWNEKDGFSIATPLFFYADDVDLSDAASPFDIAPSMSSDSPTLLLDLTTGEALPHFIELDATAPSPDEQLTVVRPVVPLDFDHHYLFAVRGLQRNAGGPIGPYAAFEALRDEVPSDDADVERRRARYDDVLFPALVEAGWSRAEVQLAWDFHTMSRDSTLGDLEYIRDDALAWWESDGGAFAITSSEDGDCDSGVIARTIEGTFTAPYYTTEDLPARRLARGPDGRPARQGTRQVSFLVRVPCSVAEGADGSGPVAASARLLQYGHGLLGGKGEARSGWLGDFADEFGYVVFATDWTGFASADVPGIVIMLGNSPTDFAFIPERSMQGMVEFVLAGRFMREVLASDDALTFDDVEVVNTEDLYYYGNSQGGILGTAYVGLSPDLERAVLGVGGGPYSLLLPRSSDFDSYFTIIRSVYEDHRDGMTLVLGLTQHLWDPVEPGGWMHDVTAGDNPKQVLLQVAIGDRQVTTLGAHIQARAFGAKLLAPARRTPYGLEEVASPVTDGSSVLVEFEYTDVGAEPEESLPPPGPDPHECPRRESPGRLQADHFLRTGEIKQFCGDDGCVALRADVCD